MDLTALILASMLTGPAAECPLPYQPDVLDRCVCPQPHVALELDLYKRFPELRAECPLAGSKWPGTSQGAWGKGKPRTDNPRTDNPPVCTADCDEPEVPEEPKDNGPPCGSPPCGNFYGNDRPDNNPKDEKNKHDGEDGVSPGPPEDKGKP